MTTEQNIFCKKCGTFRCAGDFFYRPKTGIIRHPCKVCCEQKRELKRPEPFMNMYSDELWLPIPNYEGMYDVSNYGNIRSIRRNKAGGGIIRLSFNKFGYLQVCLSKNDVKASFRVNVLVAKMFIPNPNNYPCVNHIKGIKVDNRASQLEWCTYSYNNKHSYDIGLKKSKSGENHQCAKFSNDTILKIYNESGTHAQIGEKYGLGRRHVGNIKEGKIWSTVTKHNKNGATI